MQRGILKLVEECSGVGDLLRNGQRLQTVRYTISRYQGVLEGTGMPVPGLYRIEGAIEADDPSSTSHLVGLPLTLKLQDGRSLGVALADAGGRIVDERHGPGGGCLCC